MFADVHVQGPLLSEAIFLSISDKLANSLPELGRLAQDAHGRFSRTTKRGERDQHDTLILTRPEVEVACTSVNKEWPSHFQRNPVAVAASSRCAA